MSAPSSRLKRNAHGQQSAGTTKVWHSAAYRRNGLIVRWRAKKAMLTRSATSTRASSAVSPMSSTQPSSRQTSRYGNEFR
eukprot:7375875-Prymnesium_polylepis.3